VIKEASGAGYENVDTSLHGADLWIFSHPAKDKCFFKSEVAAVTVKALRNLRGKFTGGGKNKDTSGLAAGALRVFVKSIKNGKRERSRLSCASLSDAEKVPSLKKNRNGLRLNR
jgi:hypothetical protein